MARLALRLVVALVVLAAALGAVWLWGHAQYIGPGPLARPTTVIVPRGAGLDVIAADLARAGVLARPWIFRVAVRLRRLQGRLRAGEYEFAAGVSPQGVVELLLSGRTVVRRLTVAEGLTTAEVLAQLRLTEGLEGEVPLSPGEGRLLPETYHFSHGDRREAMVRRMVAARDELVAELWPGRASGLPFAGPEEAVVLASIVEKETALPEERARIAGVFVNRLRRGMRLQSDPSVVYALTGGAGSLGRALVADDLKFASPYNTYEVAGLPPTPIANPGRASLEAVLHPASTDELYFVADGSGGHVFARTLDEHNRNVARWRRLKHDGDAGPR